jgi:hypothetical protein
VKLIQVESLEMPVKAMFKATETPNVANDSESKAEHDTVKKLRKKPTSTNSGVSLGSLGC